MRRLEEHVRGLHVAVHDAALVDHVERLRDVGEHVGGIRGPERAEAQGLAQVAPLDELHHEELAAGRPVVRGVVEPHEGAMREAREQGRLGPAPLGVVDALRGLGEHLHRDGAPEREVDAPVDARHSAAADEAVEAIAVVERGSGEGVAEHAVGGRGHLNEGSRPT